MQGPVEGVEEARAGDYTRVRAPWESHDSIEAFCRSHRCRRDEPRSPPRPLHGRRAPQRDAVRVLGGAPRAAGVRPLVRRRGAARPHLPPPRVRLRDLRGRRRHLLRGRSELLSLERADPLVLRPAPDPPHERALVRPRGAARPPLVQPPLPASRLPRPLGVVRRLLGLVRRVRRLVLLVLEHVARRPLGHPLPLGVAPLPPPSHLRVRRQPPRPAALLRSPPAVHRPPQHHRPGAPAPPGGTIGPLRSVRGPLHRLARKRRPRPGRRAIRVALRQGRGRQPDPKLRTPVRGR